MFTLTQVTWSSYHLGICASHTLGHSDSFQFLRTQNGWSMWETSNFALQPLLQANRSGVCITSSVESHVGHVDTQVVLCIGQETHGAWDARR